MAFVKFTLMLCYDCVSLILLKCYDVKLKQALFFGLCFIVTFTTQLEIIDRCNTGIFDGKKYNFALYEKEKHKDFISR